MSQQPPQQPYTEDDEIDLVDYIQVILKRKWVIVVGTVLCILGAAGYKWMQPPVRQVYESKASLLVIPPPVKSELLPNFSTSLYQTLAEAQDLKQAIIDSLNMVRGNLPLFSSQALDGVLSTSLVSQGENAPFLMDFLVTSSDTVNLHPVSIANVWAALFVKKNQGINSNEAGGSYDFIRDQYNIAKRNLESEEDSIALFTRKHNLETLRIEWTAKNSKLTEYQTDYYNRNLQLRNLENSLLDVEKALAAQETPDGLWLGSLELADTPVSEETNLNSDQRRIRQAVIQGRDRYFSLKETIRQFQLKNDLSFGERILSDKRAKLIAYLGELSQLRIDAGSVGQALQDGGEEQRRNIDIPTISSATDAGLRELASLKIGYNLLDTRRQYLSREIGRLQGEIDSLSLVHSEKSTFLENLNAQFNLESQNYQVFSSQYTALKKQVSSLKLSISELQPDVAFYSRETVRLLKDTGTLKSQITILETQQSRLTRELEIYKATFDKFAELLEDARIAKAAQPENIKVVARAVVLNPVLKEAKSLSLLLAAAVGAIASIFAAFFIEYWEQARERLKASAQ